MINNKIFQGSFLILILLSLPGCKWFSKDEAKVNESEVLISIKGKPALTINQFEDYINQMSEGNDQFKLMLQFMPDFREQLFNRKKQSLIFSEWAKNQGVRNKPEYKEKEKKYIEAIREALDTEEFIAHHKVEVSDEDAKKYYDEKRDQDPRILMSPAGINTLGVSFSKQDAASDFAEKLKKEYKNDIQKLAKERKLNVEQFGNINKDSTIDSKVREKVLNLKNFPQVLIVKGEKGKSWVVVAKGKEEAKYRPFDQSKDVIKRMLAPKKLEEMLEQSVPKYEKEYQLVENKKYFEETKKEAEKSMQQAMELTKESGS